MALSPEETIKVVAGIEHDIELDILEAEKALAFAQIGHAQQVGVALGAATVLYKLGLKDEAYYRGITDKLKGLYHDDSEPSDP